jgi:hypothetical protein
MSSSFEETEMERLLLDDPHKMGTSEAEEKKTVLFDVILCISSSLLSVSPQHTHHLTLFQ